MSMSRQDFEAIARILRYYRADWRMINEFADYLSTRNPRFELGRFVSAATASDAVECVLGGDSTVPCGHTSCALHYYDTHDEDPREWEDEDNPHLWCGPDH